MHTAEPKVRPWTRVEYYQVAELGLFPGQRVELLEGQIVVLSPQNFRHASTTDRARTILEGAFGTSDWVRMQLPIDFGMYSEPEPAVSVVAGKRDDYQDHPTTTLLIVEVSDTTLRYDRGRKASLYARAGIADYWIINLVDRQVEVYRNPVLDGGRPYGFGYANRIILTGSDPLIPLALPQGQIAVADLLPS